MSDLKIETKSKFLRVKCKNCGNEQVICERASKEIKCGVWSETLAKPRGGKAKIRGDVVEILE